MKTSSWTCALELAPNRSVVSGTPAALCEAIGRGADLRAYTEWRFEEHIAPDLAQPDPADNGLVQEIIDMRQTMLIDDRYAAGVTTLRQPILPCLGFNPNISNRTSFFMYGMDGQQASAHVALDGARPTHEPGATRVVPTPANMPKMSPTEENDPGTTASSRNFIYDFEVYRFFVRDEWKPILAHDRDGKVTGGSWEALHQAHREGCEFKVGISNLCADLAGGGAAMAHEVFTLLGTGWVHTALKRYEALTHPMVRVAPGIPMKYRPGNWEVNWVYLRTNGQATVRSLDPYTRAFRDWPTRLACRWLAR